MQGSSLPNLEAVYGHLSYAFCDVNDVREGCEGNERASV
jgi:hypothetical protein